MNPDLLIAGAMLAASVSVYGLGRLLWPKGVRVQIRPVHGVQAWWREKEIQREIDLMNQQTPAVTFAANHRVDPIGGDSDVRPSGAEVLGDAAFSPNSNLVPFTRSARGYALNFSQKGRG